MIVIVRPYKYKIRQTSELSLNWKYFSPFNAAYMGKLLISCACIVHKLKLRK